MRVSARVYGRSIRESEREEENKTEKSKAEEGRRKRKCGVEVETPTTLLGTRDRKTEDRRGLGLEEGL